MAQLFFPRPSGADQYPQALSAALQPGTRIFDPDHAMASDAEVYEKLERDAVIADAISKRKHFVAGRDWSVDAGGPTDADKTLARVVEDILLDLEGFAQARLILAKAVFLGSAYAAIYGDRYPSVAGGIGAAWWRPTALVDIDKRRFRRVMGPQPQDGSVPEIGLELYSVAHRAWEPVEHPEHYVKHVYNSEESTLGHGRGLVSALYFYAKCKTKTLGEGMNAVERWAQGLLTIGIDSEAAPATGTMADVVTDYLNKFEKMRARNIMVHDKRDEILHHDGPGQGWQLCTEMLAYLDSAIRCLCLGSNLPTAATTSGSLAMAQVQENTTEALIQFDRLLLAETINRDLIGAILRYNGPQIRAAGLAGAHPPKFSIREDKQENTQVNAAVAAQALAAGIPLRRDEVYARIGYTAPGPEDDVIVPTPPPARTF